MWSHPREGRAHGPSLPSTSGFKDIGLGMGGGSGSLVIGSFLPVRMPNGFLVTGGVIQVAGFGFLVTGDTVDVNP
jgi:hypothetical protein